MMGGVVKVTSRIVTLGGTAFTAVTGTKPSFITGAKASIKLPEKSSVWKIDAAGADDFIDEDELLTEADREPVPQPTGVAPFK
jgi:hypothetical protein